MNLNHNSHWEKSNYIFYLYWEIIFIIDI
jgi:hypothetical protein